MSPSIPSATSRFTAAAACSASGRSSGRARCSIATSNRLPSERSAARRREIAQPARVERRRHHDEFQIRSRGLLQPSEQGQREVGLQVALVKFVKRDDADILQRRVGEQSPRQRLRSGSVIGSSRSPPLRNAPDSRRSRRASPRSSATRRAAIRAARRWVRAFNTSLSPVIFASSNAGGTRVVLPAPGGASRTMFGDWRSRAMISGRSGSMGRGCITVDRA